MPAEPMSILRDETNECKGRFAQTLRGASGMPGEAPADADLLAAGEVAG
jgi:hypothetical protein